MLDDWSDHAARTTTSPPQNLTGTHTITVDYYEHAYDATAKASWTPVDLGAAQTIAGRSLSAAATGVSIGTSSRHFRLIRR